MPKSFYTIGLVEFSGERFGASVESKEFLVSRQTSICVCREMPYDSMRLWALVEWHFSALCEFFGPVHIQFYKQFNKQIYLFYKLFFFFFWLGHLNWKLNYMLYKCIVYVKNLGRTFKQPVLVASHMNKSISRSKRKIDSELKYQNSLRHIIVIAITRHLHWQPSPNLKV